MFVFYDITDRASFQDLANLLNFLANQMENICIHIVGTKADLLHLRTVETDEIAAYAITSGHSFTEVSNFSGRGVEKAFASLMEEIAALLKSKNVTLRTQNNGSIISKR